MKEEEKGWLLEQVEWSKRQVEHWSDWRFMEELAISPTKESTLHIGYPKHRGTNHMKEFIDSWK